MPEEKIDVQEAQRRIRETAPAQVSDSVTEREARAQRFAAEAAQRAAEQAAQEQHQKDRQARHQAEARRIDEETQAVLQLRIMRAREQGKPQPEPRPVPFTTPRQDEQALAEQEAGRRALEKYAKRSEAARVSTEEKDTVPGLKVG